MSPVDRSLVERKLAQIQHRISFLEKYEKEGWDKYKDNFERQKATEKLLQEVIEAALDINAHLLVENGQPAPEDYRQSFINLGKLGWITVELAQSLAPSAGLRNRLVHQYSTTDQMKVFEAIAKCRKLFGTYISLVKKKLND